MEETIKFLESYMELIKKIENAKEQKAIAWDRATACGFTGNGGARRSGVSDKVGQNIAEYDKWDNIIYELNVKAAMVQEEIDSFGDMLGEPYRTMLRKRYLERRKDKKDKKDKIEGWKLKEIAVDTGYSIDSVKRILREAREFISKNRKFPET